MNIVILLNTVAMTFYLIIGIYILLKSTKNRINLLFFLTSMSLVFWCIAEILTDVTFDAGTSGFFIKGALFCAVCFSAVILDFYLELTGSPGRKIIRIITYASAFFMSCLYVFMEGYRHIESVFRENGVIGYMYHYNLWSCLFFGYIVVYFALSIALIYLWGRNTTTHKVKRQSLVILSTMALSLIAGMGEQLLLPLLTTYRATTISPVLMSFWLAGILYSITKYRFLSLSPELVAYDIFANIDESVILLDKDLKIIFANNKTEERSGIKNVNLMNRDFSEVIREREQVNSRISVMMNSREREFTCGAHFRNENGTRPMDMKCISVYDAYDDLTGYMMILRENRDKTLFRTRFKITGREMEIIELVLSGLTNREISGRLNVTERTVETHVNNIYNKLGVKNRMELARATGDYNIFPGFEELL
jgi:DNA-binding CsgD family transcriptional regulator